MSNIQKFFGHTKRHQMTKILNIHPDPYLQGIFTSEIQIQTDPRMQHKPPPQNFNSPYQVSLLLHANAKKKLAYSPGRTFYNGVLAGLFVAFGGFLALSIGGGINAEFRKSNPALPSLSVGSLFGVALFLILIFGGELFTGNTMIMSLALFDKQTTAVPALKNLVLVFLGNLTGCVLSGALFGFLTGIYETEPYLGFVTSIAEHKVHQVWYRILLKGIPANSLVCLAVVMSHASNDMAGKAFLIWLPVLAFAAVGFEHCVANMFFVPIGAMYGASVSLGDFLFNLVFSMIGNLIGGGLIVAGSQSFMHSNHP
jgi:formate/nitrite transporter